MRVMVLITGLILIFASEFAYAEEDEFVRKVYYTTRLKTDAPVIDGRLNDACWKGGNWGTDFIQLVPEEGGKPDQKTEFKILYDDEYIYCAYRAYDNEPEKIRRYLARRDNLGGDSGGFAFDSYFDRRTAYEFDVTAAGTKLDASHLDTGNTWELDLTWDAVWDGKAALEDSAWTTEMRIPLSQLRFTNKSEHTWGLLVWRFIQRNSQEILWERTPIHGQGRVYYFSDLKGLKNIKRPRRFEILPYISGRGELFQKEAGNPFADGGRKNAAFGIDSKIGLGSNFVLDLTINPDFGQVEADPSVINLTAFETFFEEKRQFFMEGKQSIMSYQLNDDLLYYSRRIGKTPGYRPDVSDNEHVNVPEANTILNALKITGKTDNGLSIGLMQSITALEKAEIHFEDGYRKEAVEPLTGYFLGRVQKEYREGGTVLGGILTSTNRKINDNHLQFLHSNAYSGGLDVVHMWGDLTYYMRMKSVFSRVTGDTRSIMNTAQSSRHYYQRPDADYLSLDSTSASLSGYGGTFEIGKGGKGHWRFSENMTWFSPGLDFNDIGFLKTADIIMQNSKLGYVVNKPFWILRDFSFSAVQNNQWNFGGDHLLSGGSAEVLVQFHNQHGFTAGIKQESSFLDTRILRGGPAFLLPSIRESEYSVFTDRSRHLSFKCAVVNRWIDDPYSKYYRISPEYTLRLSDAFNFRNTFEYEFNRDNLQYVDAYQKDSENRYLLGRINQKTFSSTLRLTYCLTPDLTIQYYGQPFISAGTYSHFKRVLHPRASNYRDRYKNYTGAEIQYDVNNDTYLIDEEKDSETDYEMRNPDFKALQFRSNFVLRWEYNPGSTFYIIWSQNRSSSGIDELFRFRRDFRNLFDTYPHDIFMVKWSHWFSI